MVVPRRRSAGGRSGLMMRVWLQSLPGFNHAPFFALAYKSE
jgi:hypothetical protein